MEDVQKVRAISVSEFLNSIPKGEIAVVKMNIEGAEFPVLEEWKRLGQLQRVRCWLIQFHQMGADCEERYKSIARALAESHKLSFRFPWVWERWDRR
ncbi:MAG: FkbM family methyltransferase [Sandaracinaceae bacterium]|nr:FkbM family methyltransferase [Sandaracinaceae bacterium]